MPVVFSSTLTLLTLLFFFTFFRLTCYLCRLVLWFGWQKEPKLNSAVCTVAFLKWKRKLKRNYWHCKIKGLLIFTVKFAVVVLPVLLLRLISMVKLSQWEKKRLPHWEIELQHPTVQNFGPNRQMVPSESHFSPADQWRNWWEGRGARCTPPGKLNVKMDPC